MRPEAVHALRTGVASSSRPAAALRVTGDQAFDLLDAVSPRPLFLRDGQALHTLFLRDDGSPFADVVLACDDLDYLVFAEGPSPEALAAWLAERAPPGLDAAVVDLGPTHELVGLDGPYAWECMGRLVGPEVMGVPYLNLFLLPAFGGQVLRAGKTGEYGYDLLVPRSSLPELRASLRALTEEFALEEADADTLDLCALENGFFSIRTPGVARLTPVELQLQWRLDLRRDFTGKEAVERARAGARPRITWFRCPRGCPPPAAGTPLTLQGEPVGEVLASRDSVMLDAPCGLALLERRVAHPGLDVDAAGTPVRTVSSPLLRNRSLFVNPQRHAWASRAVDVFPSVVAVKP